MIGTDCILFCLGLRYFFRITILRKCCDNFIFDFYFVTDLWQFFFWNFFCHRFVALFLFWKKCHKFCTAKKCHFKRLAEGWILVKNLTTIGY